jgi:hypothetical protein
MAEMQPDVKGSREAGRRKVLLAAAAAPIVATIPNGAAWASSVFQCVQSSSDDSEGAALTLSEPDEWVRTAALTAQFVTTQQGLPSPIPLWSLDNGTTWLDESGVAQAASTDTTNCNPATQYCVSGTPTTTYVLAVYQANPDPENATAVTFQGFYPIEAPEAQSGDQGNIGLYTSCLCSVNPGTGPQCPP